MSRYKVQNWSEYNKSLINRGSLTLWISEDAMKKWQATREKHTMGPPRLYSDDAISLPYDGKNGLSPALSSACGFYF